MTFTRLLQRLITVFFLSLGLMACGGGGGGGGGSSDSDAGIDTPDPDPAPMPAPTAPDPQLEITGLNLAQSHVIPPEGKRWAQQNAEGETQDEMELHLTGERPALALIDMAPAGIANLRVEGRRSAVLLGSVPLLANSELPPSESN